VRGSGGIRLSQSDSDEGEEGNRQGDGRRGERGGGSRNERFIDVSILHLHQG